jgi:hypothetical protein
VSRNLKGLVMKIERAATLAGRVVVENQEAKASAMRSLQVRSWDLDNMSGPYSIKLEPDGSFKDSEVEPGTYRVAAAEPTYLSKLVQDDRPSAEGRIVIQAGSSTVLEITFRKASAMLRVDLVRDAAMPADQLVELRLIPEDSSLHLRPEAFQLRALVTSDQSTLGPFPPGWYLVLATYTDPQMRWLEELRAMRMKDRAVRVKLREGVTETVQVKPLAIGISP